MVEAKSSQSVHSPHRDPCHLQSRPINILQELLQTYGGAFVQVRKGHFLQENGAGPVLGSRKHELLALTCAIQKGKPVPALHLPRHH